MQRSHHQHVCEPVGNDGKILITGYGKTDDEHYTEIYDTQTDTWSDGSIIPIEGDFRGAKSIQYGESTLVVGGFHEGHQMPYIWEHVAESDTWRARDELLQEPRSHFVAILVPDDVKLCWDDK